MQNVGGVGDIRSRPNARGLGSSPRAGAPYRSNNGDDDDGKMGWSIFFGVSSCFQILLLGFLFVVGIIFLVRVPPPKALSDTCDDKNDCTHDFLETVRGVDSGCCTHCNVINDAACTNACHTDPKCQDGACVGTCKGHCVEMNALDCPKISSVNISALLGFGDSNLNTTFYGLYRECLLSSCMYTIDISLKNAALNSSNGFVASIAKVITGWGLNTTTNRTNQEELWVSSDDSNQLFKDALCMPLIPAGDRECLTAFYAIINAVDASLPISFSMTCKYMFACSDPPSYGGSIEFPARKS